MRKVGEGGSKEGTPGEIIGNLEGSVVISVCVWRLREIRTWDP